ncbi:MAG: ABC transporter permease [Candidatus Limivivens sp.]|nr:ABC transporter permease [Candidatus Limivivens sp.]
MKTYIIKRILSVIPVLLVVSVIVFSLTHLTPGSPAASILGEDATQEEIEALEEEMGLNDPLIVQYVRWVGGILHGDLGTSVVGSKPVTEMIASHFTPTISLTIFSTLIAVLIALPLGMLAARKRGTAIDAAVNGFTLAGISIPGFLIGLLLMLLICVKFKLLPVSGYKPLKMGFGKHIKCLILPSIALGFTHAALMMRMTKASMLEVLNSDYIRMAKAKGVKEFFLVTKHAFKNTLVAVITVIGQSVIGILSGAAVIETLFGIPGMGALMVNSIGRRDYEVIQGVVLVIALINVGISLIMDLIYGLIDPRIRLN